MTWPTGAVETRSHETNADVNNAGGTVIDAADQNWVYDLLERIQTKVGPDTDTSAATSVEGRLKALEAISPLTDPMTTTGDVLYSSDNSGTPARLGIGTTGQVLTVVAGLPAWADAAAGTFTSPMTTLGDLIYGSTAGAGARLGIGSAGQFLGVSGGLPAWQTPAYIADPAGAPVGAVLVKNASSVWAYLAPSATTGDVLTGQGTGAVPVWAAVPAQVPGSDIPAPSGPRVGALLQWNGTIYDKLLPGTAGQVLTAHGDNNVVGSLLTWATPAAGTMTNPMTTLSDMIYADTGGTPLRLPIGSAARILQVVAGAPAWASLGGQVVPTYFDWTYQGSAPSTPAALTGRTYWKTDGKFYGKNAAGTEYDLTAQPAAGSKHVIEDEGTPLTARTNLNFVGAGVTATDDAGNDASVATVPGYYATIKSDATTMTQRHALKLIAGTNVTLTPVDNSGSDQSELTIAASGGGGGGSSLSRTVSGLILWHDYSQVPDHALTTSADALGYAVRTTYDHGTWAFRSGLLTTTTSDNPGDCSNLVVSQRYGVFQARFYTPAVGSTQAGLEFAVQAGVDTRMLYLVRNSSADLYDRTAGGWGSDHTGTHPSGMIQGQWIAAKVHWTATQTCSTWVNRVLLDSAFTHTGIPLAAGGIGLAAVSAANSVFRDYAIYTSTVLTVDGLSGTQAFRLLDAGGTILAASGTQSSGSATIDLATVADYPVVGVIEVLTATGGSVVTGGRYPAEGFAGDICPGDTYTLS